MTNFFSGARLGFLLFCSIQLFSHVQPVDSLQAIEYNIDAEAIMSDNNIVNQIDRLFDAGLRYQEETGKKFEYKRFMDKAYKLLDNQDTIVSDEDETIKDEVKKDLKKRIKNRIEVRHFQQNTREFFNPELTDYCDYTDAVESAILETCIGTILRAIPELRDVGNALIEHGLSKANNERAILFNEKLKRQSFVYERYYPEPRERERPDMWRDMDQR